MTTIKQNQEISITTQSSKRLKLLKKKRLKLEKQIDNLINMQINRGGHDERLYNLDLSYKAQIESINDEIETIQEVEEDSKDWAGRFLAISHDILSFGIFWKTKSFKTRNQELKKYIDHVIYRNNPFSLEVVYTAEIQELITLFPQDDKKKRKQKTIN